MKKKKGDSTARHIQNVVEILQALRLSFSVDPPKRALFVAIQSSRGATEVLNIRVSSTDVEFTACALKNERIPDRARPKLSEVLLSRDYHSLLHYGFDAADNVILTMTVPADLVAAGLVTRVIEELRHRLDAFDGEVLQHCALVKGHSLLFPARLQPPHKGHIETICRLLEGDSGVLAKPSSEPDRKWIQGAERLVISIGPMVDVRQKGNPLTSGERKELLAYEIDRNPRLTRHEHRIQLVDSPPAVSDLWIPALLKTLSEPPAAVATANSQTRRAAVEARIPVVEIAREEDRALSGTAIRSLIADGRMEEAKVYLTEPIYEKLRTEGWLETIRDIEGSR